MFCLCRHPVQKRISAVWPPGVWKKQLYVSVLWIQILALSCLGSVWLKEVLWCNFTYIFVAHYIPARHWLASWATASVCWVWVTEAFQMTVWTTSWAWRRSKASYCWRMWMQPLSAETCFPQRVSSRETSGNIKKRLDYTNMSRNDTFSLLFTLPRELFSFMYQLNFLGCRSNYWGNL